MRFKRFLLLGTCLTFMGFRLGCHREELLRANAFCSSLETEPYQGKAQVFEGTVESHSGYWEVLSPKLKTNQAFTPFNGRLFLSPRQGAGALVSGQRVRIWGRFRCRPSRRNPARLADSWLSSERTVVVPTAKVTSVRVEQGSFQTDLARVQFRNWLDNLFTNAPKTQGYVRAVWTGDASGISEAMWGFYREGGLLHILALSGQHVAAFSLLFSSLFWFAARMCQMWNLPRVTGIVIRGATHLPLVGAIILFWASGGLAPMRRTMAMVMAFEILRLRRLNCPPFQLLCSSVAFLILCEPILLGSASFLLSSTATAFILHPIFSRQMTRSIKNYLLVSTIMPIFLLPISAFFFGKVSLLSPLSNMVLCWLWSVLLIPFCFGCPWLIALMPAHLRVYVFRPIEAFWQYFEYGHAAAEAWVSGGYVTVIRPTWLELLSVELLLGMLFWWLCTVLFTHRR